MVAFYVYHLVASLYSSEAQVLFFTINIKKSLVFM